MTKFETYAQEIKLIYMQASNGDDLKWKTPLADEFN